MAPAAGATGLNPQKPEEFEGLKAAGEGSSRAWKSGFVTDVTKVRGLLKAAREALALDERDRTDRVLAEAQRVLQRVAVRAGEVDVGDGDGVVVPVHTTAACRPSDRTS